jgi:hypothetical protein
MTSRAFDSRKAAASFAKRVSKENKTTVRLIEREGNYFVEGEYPSSNELPNSSESESISSTPPTTLDYDSWIKERGFKKSEKAEEQWWQACQLSKQIESIPIAVSRPNKVVKNISENKKLTSLGSAEKNTHPKSKRSSSGARNSISEALKRAYISNGLPPPKPHINKADSISISDISATNDKQKKRKKIPLKERGLSGLKIRLENSLSDKALEKKLRIENARKKLLAQRLILESLENQVAPPPTTKIISTYSQGTVVSKSTKQRGNSICPRCGGDGGVNGGCGKCDGTGWV